jgi:hypothetical protein
MIENEMAMLSIAALVLFNKVAHHHLSAQVVTRVHPSG